MDSPTSTDKSETLQADVLTNADQPGRVVVAVNLYKA